MRHLLALLILGATASHVPATLDAQPLRANLWFDEYAGVASFDLNRPAHVAIFALRPLGSIEMIYPASGWGVGVEGAFRTGRHSVRTESRMYHLVRGHSDRRDSRYGASGQTYILLIASDRPLDLDGFFAHGTVPWLNHPSVTWNPLLATDHLAREIVPGQGRSEWTAAYHVIWPEASFRLYDGRIPVTRVRCPGGAVVLIATQVVRSGRWTCPDRNARPPVARPRAPRSPPVTGVLPKRPRPTERPGATPTRGRGQGDIDGRRARPRPDAKPGAGSRPGTVTNVIPKRRPAARPNVRPNPAKPNVRPNPAVKPKVRPKPSAKPTISPEPKPVPKPKPKKKGGG